MGTELATSPAIFTSAVITGPQVKKLTNWPQLSKGLPVGPFAWVNGNVSDDLRMRKPVEPVSITMLSMVWQFEVPGTHTVTLAKAVSAELTRPALTTIGTELATAPPPPEPPLLLDPPPPHPVASAKLPNKAKKKNLRTGNLLRAHIASEWLQAEFAAAANSDHRRGRNAPAWCLSSARPGLAAER